MTDRHLWFDPGFGASGDMMLGALLGLGASLEAVRADLGTLDVEGWTLSVESVQRAGISATRALVETSDETHHHRSWSSIDRRLASSPLPAPVAAGSRRTFELLAQVEAEIHDIAVDTVHFHEVGAIDAIVDIVGAWSALHQLNVSQVSAGPVGVGNGVVTASHGLLPAPAPATVGLLLGASIRPLDYAAETVTPTGAALLTSMVERWGPIPGGQLVASARGAGGRNPSSHPNVLGALVVDVERVQPSGQPGVQPDQHTETAVGLELQFIKMLKYKVVMKMKLLLIIIIIIIIVIIISLKINEDVHYFHVK